MNQILSKSLYVIIMTDMGSSEYKFRCTELYPSSPVFACACFIISLHLLVTPHPSLFFCFLPSLHPFPPLFITHFHSFLHRLYCWPPHAPTNRHQRRTVLLPDQALSQLHPTHHGPRAGRLGGVQGNSINAKEAGTGLLWGRLDG